MKFKVKSRRDQAFRIVMLVMIVLFVCLFVAITVNSRMMMAETRRSTERESERLKQREEILRLRQGLETLNNDARLYAETGDTLYVINYFADSDVRKNVEDTLFENNELENSVEIVAKLQEVLDKSFQLSEIEYYSMRLVAESTGIIAGKLPDEIESRKLTSEDMQLSAEEKSATARAVLFDDNYMGIEQEMDEIIEEMMDISYECLLSEKKAFEGFVQQRSSFQRILSVTELSVALIFLGMATISTMYSDKEKKLYMDAVMKKIVFVYDADLTRNIIKKRPSFSSKANPADFVGMKFPMKYDEYLEEATKRFGYMYSDESGEKTAAMLIADYNNGETCIEFEYYYPKLDLYRSKTILLSRTRFGRHIMAKVFVCDVSESRKAERERISLLSSLSDMYLSMYHIDLKHNVAENLKESARANRSLRMAQSDFLEIYDSWLENEIDETSKSENMDFFDLFALPRKLSEENAVSREVKTKNKGWVLTSFVAYKRDVRGKATEILWLTRSIDAEKHQEFENETIKNAVSQSYILLVYMDYIQKSYSAIISNKAFWGIIPPEGTLDRAEGMLLKLVTEEYKETIKAFVDPKTVSERLGNQSVITCDYLSKDGMWSRAGIIPARFDADGKLIGAVFGVQKIDAEKRKQIKQEEELTEAYEEAKRANASKTMFFSHMSHDIRTPMNAIVGMTRIATDNIDDKNKITDCLKKIKDNSDHLLSLINDCLDLSKIESGKVTITHEVMKLEGTVNKFLSILQGYAVGRNLEIVTSIQPWAVQYVYTDELHLRQIILNILSNSVKYTPDGGKIKIIAENELIDENRILVKFTVSDTGIGMSEEFLAKIFDPFSQADEHGARTQYKGTGLGMSIVKHYVDLMGGKIRIESELGKGTTTYMEFPMDIARNEDSAKDDAENNETSNVDLNGVKVLLVEDNDINREIARVLLEGFGMEVTEAADGQEAIDRFKSSRLGEFKCILMDIMMPIMNGYEATKAIREMDRTDAADIPIIAMTANAFAEDVRQSLESGMSAHVTKPIDPDIVRKTVATWVGKQV